MTEIKLTKRIKYAEDVYKELTERAGFPTDLASDFLNNIPDADAVEIVHGQWIESKTEKLYFGYGMKGYYDYPELCSVCHYDATENERGVGNYCPNCGAKMDGGKKE